MPIVRLVGGTTLVASLLALAATYRAAHMLDSSGEHSWIALLGVPFLCFGASIVAAIWTVLHRRSSISTVVFETICYFMTPFSVVYAAAISLADPNYFTDGVAYWAGVTLPCFWIGGPLAVVGTLVGFYRATRCPPLWLVVASSILVGWAPVSHLVLGPAYRWSRELAYDIFTYVFSF